jgi:hypothetical protein
MRRRSRGARPGAALRARPRPRSGRAVRDRRPSSSTIMGFRRLPPSSTCAGGASFPSRVGRSRGTHSRATSNRASSSRASSEGSARTVLPARVPAEAGACRRAASRFACSKSSRRVRKDAIAPARRSQPRPRKAWSCFRGAASRVLGRSRCDVKKVASPPNRERMLSPASPVFLVGSRLRRRSRSVRLKTAKVETSAYVVRASCCCCCWRNCATARERSIANCLTSLFGEPASAFKSFVTFSISRLWNSASK